MKRILSFVLALCLIVGLLPAVAIPHAHAEVTSAQVFLFGAYRDIDLDDTTDIPEALYWVNGAEGEAPKAATAEDNWNYSLAIIEDIPTLTLRNADYKYNANFMFYKAGGNIKLRYEGTNNVHVSQSTATRYFLKNTSTSGHQYIEGAEGAVLNVTGGAATDAMITITSKAYLTISGGTFYIEKTNAGGTSSVVNAQYAKTVVENCNLTVKNSISSVANQRPIVTMGYSSGSVTFNNANVHIEGYGIIGLLAGVWDVNNSKAIYAANLTINGNSNVKVLNKYSNTNAYSGRGIHAAKITVTGGSLEAEGLNQAVYGSSTAAPVLSSYAGDYAMYITKDGAAAGEYVESTYFKVIPAAQAPSETPTQAPTTVPTEAPTEAPTQAPTVVPTEAPTEAPTEEPEPEVDPDPDITIEKTSSHRAAHTVSPGKTIDFTLVITNKGSQEKLVSVTDRIPYVAEFVSGCEQVTGTKMKWVFTLGAGESKTITYTLKAKNDETYLGMPFNGVATANGVKASCYNVYVERGLGNVDQRLMETAIDAFRQYTNFKDVNLLRMIWYVAISKSVSYNDTNGKTMTPAQILNYIYTGEGSFGGTEGSGEEAASAAVDFVKAVIPTLFGGKGVTADQMAKLHGEMAAAVEKADLTAGDAFFVQETEDDTAGKLYIYNGKRLFELGKGVIEVDTDAVLASLPNAYRYAGLRISYVIANRKDFSEDRQETLTDVQKAIVSIAEALILRGDRAQYDAGGMMAPDKRFEYKTNTPEDYTSDSWKYSNCAAMTFDSYYYGLGLDTGSNWYTAQIINSARSQKIFYYEPTGSETEEEKQVQYDKFYAALQPGDTIVIRRRNDSGHAMLYIGNGIVIHSTGGSYKSADTSGTGTGVEQYEATVRFLNVYDYFDPKCENGGAYSYYVWGGEVIKIGLYRPHKNFKGSIPQETLNRMANLKDIAVEKVASKAFGQTVNVGEELTYTFKLLNAGDVDKILDITDVVLEGCTLISAPGATMNGNNLSWQVTVPAGEKLEVSYTVKVGANVPNNELTNDAAKVGGVSVRSAKLFVKRTLTETEQQQIIDAVNSLSGTTLKNLELANEIYKVAFGVEDVFAHLTLSTFHSQMFEKLDTGKYVIIDNQYGAMAAPGLCGGRNFNCDDEGVYGQISRLAREENLIVGDILFARTSSANGVYIYLGDGICWSLNTNAEDTAGLATRLERFVGYRNYWAVLRPSMVWKTPCEHTNTTTVEAVVNATCTAVGSKTVSVICECGVVISETVEEIAALGHTAVTTVETVNATCTEAGSKKTTVTCEVCGEVISKTTEKIPAPGHSYANDAANECSVCGAVRANITVVDDEVFLHANGMTGVKVHVFNITDKEVADIDVWNNLRAADPAFKSYTKFPRKLANGTYVLRIQYNDADGVMQADSHQVTIDYTPATTTAPQATVRGKTVSIDQQGTNVRKVHVFYVDGKEIADTNDWYALKAADPMFRSYTKTQLTVKNSGAYVVRIEYVDENGDDQKISRMITVQ